MKIPFISPVLAVVLLSFLIASMLLTNCTESIDSAGLDQLTPPLIVVAVQKPIPAKDIGSYYEGRIPGSILIRDSNNAFWSRSGGDATVDALIESYNMGDTIK